MTAWKTGFHKYFYSLQLRIYRISLREAEHTTTMTSRSELTAMSLSVSRKTRRKICGRSVHGPLHERCIVSGPANIRMISLCTVLRHHITHTVVRKILPRSCQKLMQGRQKTTCSTKLYMYLALQRRFGYGGRSGTRLTLPVQLEQLHVPFRLYPARRPLLILV